MLWIMVPGPTSSPGPMRRRSGAAVGLALLAVLVLVNGIAIGTVLDARRTAREAARSDLELETQVHARSLEAALAGLRADLAFLAQSPPIAQLAPLEDQTDPMVRRWRRLDAESTLLLFFVPQPAVQRVALEDAEGTALIVAGRLDGAPQILSTALAAASSNPDSAAPSADGLLEASWNVGSSEGARLRAWIDPNALVGQIAVGLGDRLELQPERPDPTQGRGLEVTVAAPVVDDAWSPAVSWWLIRREADLQVVRSFEAQTRRYRTVLALNLVGVLLTLGLGLLAVRQARTNARLEAENAQQARIRELERTLMHSERLASVGRLAAGMAHEINNPLEGMANYLTVLEEDLGRGAADDAAQWTPRLREGLDRAAGVLRQVLAFSDPGKGPKEPVDLTRVIDQTVDFVSSNPAFRTVDISWQAPIGPITVQANPTALGQLVLNLLLNACEAHLEREPSGTHGSEGAADGPIRVTCATVDHPPRAVFEVADRGPGFDQEILDHLFEPFFSGRGSSGLGLAVCHGIVQDLGGTIVAANRDEGGARFRVELPLDTPNDQRRTPADP